MRTLRLALTGTVVLLLLGMGAVALAQDAAQTPAYVTGTNVCRIDPAQPGDCSRVGGVEHCRGQELWCQLNMSDPRVSGPSTVTYNSDCLDERGCLFWGSQALDGPDGGWDCDWSGLQEPYEEAAYDALAYGVCLGADDYEGLTWVFYHAIIGDEDFGDGTSWHGLIYADELPSLTPPTVTEQ